MNIKKLQHEQFYKDAKELLVQLFVKYGYLPKKEIKNLRPASSWSKQVIESPFEKFLFDMVVITRHLDAQLNFIPPSDIKRDFTNKLSNYRKEYKSAAGRFAYSGSDEHKIKMLELQAKGEWVQHLRAYLNSLTDANNG